MRIQIRGSGFGVLEIKGLYDTSSCQTVRGIEAALVKKAQIGARYNLEELPSKRSISLRVRTMAGEAASPRIFSSLTPAGVISCDEEAVPERVSCVSRRHLPARALSRQDG